MRKTCLIWKACWIFFCEHKDHHCQNPCWVCVMLMYNQEAKVDDYVHPQKNKHCQLTDDIKRAELHSNTVTPTENILIFLLLLHTACICLKSLVTNLSHKRLHGWRLRSIRFAKYTVTQGSDRWDAEYHLLWFKQFSVVILAFWLSLLRNVWGSYASLRDSNVKMV